MRLFLWLLSRTTAAAVLHTQDTGQLFARAPPPPAHDEIVTHQVLLEEAALTHGAVALDGTPGMYYFKNATSTASRLKFHVYLEGGGWCTSTASCAKRALTMLGSSSSKFHDKTLSLPSGCRCDGGGYFSSSAIRNPLMHDWNQVFVNYLDGGSFSGNQSKPDRNGTGSSKVYYRGRRILDAVLDSLLMTQGMANATDIVLSGCSAGGQAIYLQADYVASRLPPAAKFRTLADSGYFLREGGTGHSFPWIYNAMSAVTNANCEAAESDPSQCIFAQVVSKYISTPVFALQSVVDNHQVCPGCSCDNCTNQEEINNWAHRMEAALESGFLSGPNAKTHGGFVDTCDHHCGSWASDASAAGLDIWINGTSAGEAFAAWYDGKVPLNTVWQQQLPTTRAPRCTACCHKPNPSSRN